MRDVIYETPSRFHAINSIFIYKHKAMTIKRDSGLIYDQNKKEKTLKKVFQYIFIHYIRQCNP
jgi:hypothetical protein